MSSDCNYSTQGKQVLTYQSITLNSKFPLPIKQAYSPRLFILSYDSSFSCEEIDTKVTNSRWTKWTANELPEDEVYSCVDQQSQEAGNVVSIGATSSGIGPTGVPSPSSTFTSTVSPHPEVTVTASTSQLSSPNLPMGGMIAVIIISAFFIGIVCFVCCRKPNSARREDSAAVEHVEHVEEHDTHENLEMTGREAPPPYEQVAPILVTPQRLRGFIPPMLSIQLFDVRERKLC